MFASKAGIKQVTVKAVVIRKDGTVENLGIIASNKNPSLIEKFLRKVNKNA